MLRTAAPSARFARASRAPRSRRPQQSNKAASRADGQFRAAVFDNGVRRGVEFSRRLRAGLDPAHLERALLGHSFVTAGARADRERTLRGVEPERDARELA